VATFSKVFDGSPYPEIGVGWDTTQPRIDARTSFLALAGSSLVRMLWVVLIVITPSGTNGTLVFYVVLGCVGIVTLHWLLDRFGWTVSLSVAASIRVFPWLIAGVAAAMFGVGISAIGVAAVALVELATGMWILRIAARRSDRWIAPVDEAAASSPRVWAEDVQYDEDMSALIRAARVSYRP